MNVSAVSSRLTTQMVSATALRSADNDGDGLRGAAALNDGDSASTSARIQAQASRSAGRTVDVKA